VCNRPSRWQFIAFHRWVSVSCALENPQRFRAIRATAAFLKVLCRPQGGNFLRHGHIDQLVQRYAFHLRNLTQLLKQRGLQP
jgi:hypothetical protein